jgi:hypothetical protein
LEGFVVLFTTAFNEDSFAENAIKTPAGWCIFVNGEVLNDLKIILNDFVIKEAQKHLTL